MWRGMQAEAREEPGSVLSFARDWMNSIGSRSALPEQEVDQQVGRNDDEARHETDPDLVESKREGSENNRVVLLDLLTWPETRNLVKYDFRLHDPGWIAVDTVVSRSVFVSQ